MNTQSYCSAHRHTHTPLALQSLCENSCSICLFQQLQLSWEPRGKKKKWLHSNVSCYYMTARVSHMCVRISEEEMTNMEMMPSSVGTDLLPSGDRSCTKQCSPGDQVIRLCLIEDKKEMWRYKETVLCYLYKKPYSLCQRDCSVDMLSSLVYCQCSSLSWFCVVYSRQSTCIYWKLTTNEAGRRLFSQLQSNQTWTLQTLSNQRGHDASEHTFSKL